MILTIKRDYREDCYYLCHQEVKVGDIVNVYYRNLNANNELCPPYKFFSCPKKIKGDIMREQSLWRFSNLEVYIKPIVYKILCKIPEIYKVLADDQFDAKDTIEYFKERLK